MQEPIITPGRFGMRLPRQSASPDGGGWTDVYYDTDDDIIYYYDYTRAKWLSLSMQNVQTNTPSSSIGAHYQQFGSLVMTSTYGFEFGKNATVVGASFKSGSSSSASVQLRSGLSTIATLGTYGASNDFRDFTLNTTVTASVVYQVYVNGAAGNEAGIIYYRWRP